MRDLAIIMPTHNRPDIALCNLLKARCHFPGVPIYVFDDASDDAAAVAAAVAQVPSCTLIRSEKNIGPAGARRRLIDAADARWCLALDDDCHPRPDFDPSRWLRMEPRESDPIVVSFRYYNAPYDEFAPRGRLKTGPSRSIMGGASLISINLF